MELFKDERTECPSPTVYCDVKNCTYHDGKNACAASKIHVGARDQQRRHRLRELQAQRQVTPFTLRRYGAVRTPSVPYRRGYIPR